ncbi:hypothetical protein Tfont_02120 [Tepidimonas fonticaldi]|uniref:Uncharacterized protein n=1 Tax=Tepidimonas fonticaldi TaxID=1101373 RepID=A0A554XJE2_9BURK|nr:hypothetical protein [Tepidimonas fonticaldi]TSE35935.1 hypothetical protein Tfont_02120 [Tepidimonas fonticaldi]
MRSITPTWRLALLTAALLGSTAAWAKLPAPTLTEEQKAAAELAKAKAAHQAKVDAFKTCKAAERAAEHYFKQHPQAAKPAGAPACADPGRFAEPGAPAAPAGPAAAPAKKS